MALQSFSGWGSKMGSTAQTSPRSNVAKPTSPTSPKAGARRRGRGSNIVVRADTDLQFATAALMPSMRLPHSPSFQFTAVNGAPSESFASDVSNGGSEEDEEAPGSRTLHLNGQVWSVCGAWDVHSSSTCGFTRRWMEHSGLGFSCGAAGVWLALCWGLDGA